jgi:glycosyltransferase involved in cell wall biosynthesis
MAAALADIGKKVELVIQAALIEILLRKRRNVSAWYGLPEALVVRRLPLTPFSIRDGDGLFRSIPRGRFVRIASWYCRLRRPDLVYTRSWRLSAATTRFGIPTILETHDRVPEHSPSRYDQVATASRLPTFKGLVTISPLLRDTYVKLGVPEQKVIVVPGGVDLLPFDEANEALPRNSKTRLPKVGYCGSLHEGRGIDTLLESARMLPHVQFMLIGGSPEDISHWKCQGGALSNVDFVGFIAHSDVPKRLVQFDILCMPYSDSLEASAWMSPMKLFEYMAAGKAIVATDLPVVREILQYGHNAILCRPDSPGELTAAIRQLCANPELRMALGRQARADVTNYTWKARASQIIENLGVD